VADFSDGNWKSKWAFKYKVILAGRVKEEKFLARKLLAGKFLKKCFQREI
jgi:hypothetical protein